MDLIKIIYKKYNYLIKLLITLLLFSYLFLNINFNDIKNIYINTNYVYLLIPALVYFGSNIFSSLKWRKLLLFYGVRESLKYLYKLYLIGGFYNNFLPSTVGGDGYKFIQLNNKKYNKKIILSSIITERGIGYFTLFLISIPLSFFYINKIFLNTSFLYIQFILIILLIIPFVFIIYSNKIRNIKYISTISIISKFFNLLDTIKQIFPDKKLLFYTIYQSIIFNLLASFSLWIIFYSIHFRVDFLIVLYVSSIVKLFSIIPISLNNIGITESMYVFLFIIFGIDPTTSLFVALVGRTISLICSLFSGILLLDFKNIIHNKIL